MGGGGRDRLRPAAGRRMDISQFDYHLPPELVAQFPSRRRDESRLMIVDRAGDGCTIVPFRRIADYLEDGEALVVNDTRVFKARLRGNRSSGARVEVFLVRPLDRGDGDAWLALVSPSRRLREGEDVLFGDDRIRLREYQGKGRWAVGFASRAARERIIRRHGRVPLPHYIRREDGPADLRRYQTVFADRARTGAVAAPTAGFHFTRPLLHDLAGRGVRLVRLTLHVGPGTFKPVSADNIDDHVVDPEWAELPESAARVLNGVRDGGGRITAVGTTSVRTLESVVRGDGRFVPLAGMVDLYIRPGYHFRGVDRLITNFHLPRSSLLILVAAFAGRDRILEAYRYAIAQRMRFYSYGDAMLIL